MTAKEAASDPIVKIGINLVGLIVAIFFIAGMAADVKYMRQDVQRLESAVSKSLDDHEGRIRVLEKSK